MKKSNLAMLVCAALLVANANADTAQPVESSGTSVNNSKLINTVADSTDTNSCDDAANADYAQCDLENSANDFHWVDKSDYRDNVVQVVYGASSCGGLLLGGDLILTARHCTPDWNETTEWAYGDTVSIYQGIEAKADDNLVYEGEVEIIVHDVDQRVEDGIDYLTEHWVPIVDSMVENWLNLADGNYTSVDFEDWYFSSMRAQNTSEINDVALIKLPVSLPHANSNALVTLDNLDNTLTTDYLNYEGLISPSADTKFSYQGWGKNAYGVSPEKMKEWELSFFRGQVMMNPVTFDEQTMFLNFLTDVNFIQSCNEEALINSGDSGTPLFTEDNYTVGVASRISANTCGFTAEWSAHLTNFEFYKANINKLVAPSELSETVYTDSETPAFTFDVQNLSYDTHAVTPSLTGNFNLTHDCPQTLAPLEHCRVTVTYVGDTQNANTVSSSLQLNSEKAIPVNLQIAGTVTPTEAIEVNELPSEIEIHIGLNDEETITRKIDVSWLSTPDNILEPSMVLDFDSAEGLYWSYGETIGTVDLSEDSTVGKYREAPTEWVVQFFTHRDLPEEEQHLAAKPGVYNATIQTSTATIPVTVYYREDEIQTDPDTGDDTTDGDDNDSDGGDGSDDLDSGSGSSSGGSSGGSLGWMSLLMLLALRRRK